MESNSASPCQLLPATAIPCGPVNTRTGSVNTRTGPIIFRTGPGNTRTGPANTRTGPVIFRMGPVQWETILQYFLFCRVLLRPLLKSNENPTRAFAGSCEGPNRDRRRAQQNRWDYCSFIVYLQLRHVGLRANPAGKNHLTPLLLWPTTLPTFFSWEGGATFFFPGPFGPSFCWL